MRIGAKQRRKPSQVDGTKRQKIWPNVAQGPCWGRVAFRMQSGTSDAGWKSVEASTMIRQRIIAMRTSFDRYAGLWKSRHVSTRIRRTIFQGVINGAAISVCEPYVSPRPSGTSWHHTQTQTQVPNTTVDHEEAKTEMVPIDACTSRSSLYLATLFGSFDWEKIADFGLNGSLTHRALPGLRQLADDSGFVWGWVPMFLNHDFSGVSEYSA